MGIIRRVLPALLVSLLALLSAPAAQALSLPDGSSRGGPSPAVSTPAGSDPFPSAIDEDPEECSETIPAAYSTDVTGSGPAVSLEVLILLDGVEQQAATEAVALAARPYSSLEVNLVPTYQKVEIAPDSTRPDPDTGRPRPAVEVQDLVAAAKAAVGGERPTGIDVVYVMTSKDLYLAGSSDDIAGWADCIGGVRYPKRAFAAGETPASFNSLGLNYYLDATAKVLGHEIGHLLGAQHQYANCAQGADSGDVSRMEPAICTLMFMYLDFQSLHFGALDGAVIQGHARAYAS